LREKIILSLCGGSGSWESPYAKSQEYRVINVTLPENDVRAYDPPPNVYGILAAPPCEAFSFARRSNGIMNKLFSMDIRTGLEIVNACLSIIKKANPYFWALENPQGDLNRHLGNPRYIFQPWMYGSYWTKKTCLWGKFNIPRPTHTLETCPKLDLYTRPGRRMPSIAFCHKSAIDKIPEFRPFKDYVKTDYDLRSLTPTGFARAFFESNR
jgi:hypothetical protein